MKYKNSVVFIVLVFCLLCATHSYAHPGRTDEDGGHYDRSTGEYHYHHGHPAHQHPNGVCPYKSNSQSSSTINLNSPKNEAKTSPSSKSYILPVCIFVFGLLLFYARYMKKLEDKAIKQSIQEPSQTQDKIQSLEKQLTQKEDELFQAKKSLHDNTVELSNLRGEIASYKVALNQANYKIMNMEQTKKQLEDIINRQLSEINTLNISLSSLTKQIATIKSESISFYSMSEEEMKLAAGVPDGVSFDENSLPHYYVNPTVEKHFTVYISYTGKRYHRICGCSGAYTPMHLFTVSGTYTPCTRCVPFQARNYQIPLWYYKYLHLKAQQKYLFLSTEDVKCQSTFEKLEENIEDTDSHDNDS